MTWDLSDQMEQNDYQDLATRSAPEKDVSYFGLVASPLASRVDSPHSSVDAGADRTHLRRTNCCRNCPLDESSSEELVVIDALGDGAPGHTSAAADVAAARIVAASSSAVQKHLDVTRVCSCEGTALAPWSVRS